ncbi:MAG TPA: GNAT family N-acetyltransferase [Blastocatellia bacterium]|nr:GNAT family N-acetyltransferase [Blastocatellia bacterium]
MYALTSSKKGASSARESSFVTAASETIERLTARQEPEVLAFLAERPMHTFGLAGFIRSNGIVSPHNRGSFYAYRNEEDRLLGVALIGHFILFETRCDRALEAFARLAQQCKRAHMLLGERTKVQQFWELYCNGGQAPRLFCRELLLEQRWSADGPRVPGLRLATSLDLDLIVPAHAQTAFDESGVDPLVEDADGFRKRCARRIEQGHTWVLVENDRLIFKAEVVADTPEVIYLEGVWVDPQERGKGYGSRCMTQLTETFLRRTESVCLLVNECFPQARAFYQKAGYKAVSSYDTVFLRREQ